MVATCSFYFIFFLFIYLFFLFVVDFVIHWNETAKGLHVFPIPIPPPTSHVHVAFKIKVETKIKNSLGILATFQMFNSHICL